MSYYRALPEVEFASISIPVRDDTLLSGLFPSIMESVRTRERSRGGCSGSAVGRCSPSCIPYSHEKFSQNLRSQGRAASIAIQLAPVVVQAEPTILEGSSERGPLVERVAVLPSRLANGAAPRLDDGHLVAARWGLICADGHRGRCPDAARRDGHPVGHRSPPVSDGTGVRQLKVEGG